MKDEPKGQDEPKPARPPAQRRRANAGGLALSGAQFAGVGVQFAVTIVVFALLGSWGDDRLGTSPWLLIVGVFLGAGGGFYSIYRALMGAQARDRVGKGREE